MAELYVDGHSQSEIAAHFGCSRQAVNKTLRKHFDFGTLKMAHRKVRRAAPPAPLTTAPPAPEVPTLWRGLDLHLAILLKRAGLTWEEICRSNGLEVGKADALRLRALRFAKAHGLPEAELRRKA